MKSIVNVGNQPAGIPLLADNVTEFHAARLVLLIKICGVKGSIDGLTKLAKLDFFVRYPLFFQVAEASFSGKVFRPSVAEIESSMVRHHYGPWDKRYYHVLPFIEARGLMRVEQQGKAYRFTLTEKGDQIGESLLRQESFDPLVKQMRRVKTVLGNKSGSRLKNLIYQLFEEEVARKQLGEVIQ